MSGNQGPRRAFDDHLTGSWGPVDDRHAVLRGTMAAFRFVAAGHWTIAFFYFMWQMNIKPRWLRDQQAPDGHG